MYGMAQRRGSGRDGEVELLRAVRIRLGVGGGGQMKPEGKGERDKALPALPWRYMPRRHWLTHMQESHATAGLG